MATHKRNGSMADTEGAEGYVDYFKEWQAYQAEHEVKRLSVKATQEEAERLGVSYEELHRQKTNEYYDMRDRFHAEMEVKRTEADQIALMRNNNLDSTCSVFQRADRILTGLSVNVFLNEGADLESPAYNDGKDVTFNANAIKALDEDTITSLHGLNYHEVSHLLFTPRVGSQLGKWASEDKNRQQVFNILEDCRAETYLVAKYPSVRPFLVALLGEYLTETPEQFDDNFILLAGRRYFSLEARQLSARGYITKHGEDKARTVYQVCSEYRTLVFPRDFARAQKLIEQLIFALGDDINSMPDTQSGCSGRKGMRNGRPESEKAQQAIQDMIGNAEGEIDDNVFTTAWGDEADNDGNNVSEEQGRWASQELDESIKQAIAEAKSDRELIKKVTETSRAISKDGSTKSILGKARHTTSSPSNAEVISSRMFAQELERLRIESDPAWNLEKPSGKLNVRRAMHADINDLNKLFDRWEIGNDEYDIEACILIDRSGSMWHEIGSACRSAWIIKRALERIDGRVSAMTFSTTSRTLFSADEPAKSNEVALVEANGGTDPYYALLEAERIFMQSQRKTKLLFILTDGHFNAGQNDATIERMNQMGVMTNLSFLTNASWAELLRTDRDELERLRHNAQNVQVIETPADLVKVAKDVVKNQLKRKVA